MAYFSPVSFKMDLNTSSKKICRYHDLDVQGAVTVSNRNGYIDSTGTKQHIRMNVPMLPYFNTSENVFENEYSEPIQRLKDVKSRQLTTALAADY